jgi:hypothetical protein
MGRGAIQAPHKSNESLTTESTLLSCSRCTDIEPLVAEPLARFGGIAVVVNNAGASGGKLTLYYRHEHGEVD